MANKEKYRMNGNKQAKKKRLICDVAPVLLCDEQSTCKLHSYGRSLEMIVN